MKKADSFTFKGNPMPKPRMTRADTWKKRPIVLDYWAFKDEITSQANKNGFSLGEAYRAEFYIKMPKSWSNKKKDKMKGTPHRQRPDIDNLIKAIQDTLLKEDSAVWYVVSTKKWAYDGCVKIENFPVEDLHF